MSSDDHDHKHCLEMFEKLSEFIDGELDFRLFLMQVLAATL